MRPPRRMRRFADKAGREYDELPDGRLRQRLRRGEPGPHHQPLAIAVIEHRVGRLTEVDTTSRR